MLRGPSLTFCCFLLVKEAFALHYALLPSRSRDSLSIAHLFIHLISIYPLLLLYFHNSLPYLNLSFLFQGIIALDFKDQILYC